MDLLFDSLGPDARAPEVSAALDALATVHEAGRGAVFTRPEVAAAILDLSGYTADRPLHRLRLLEPAFGEGDFLLPALDRLLEECEASLAPVRCEELHYPVFDEFREASYARRYQILCERLVERQLYSAAALELSPAGSDRHRALSPATSIRNLFAEFAGKLLAAQA